MIDIITDIAAGFFRGIHGAHGWDHIERVVALCHTIGPKEGCDMTVLEVAALLHDIGRKECDQNNGADCHAEYGARLAREQLEALDLSQDFIEKVIHCIEAHRYRGGAVPESIEAKVLYDADKLDSIGAVGIGRAFQFAGEVGAKMHDPSIDPETSEAYGPEDTAWREYMVKLRHIQGKMLTVTGAILALERSAFMDEFFTRLDKEVAGEL